MFAKIFTALMVALTGLLPSSCTSTNGKGPSANVAAISMNSTNRNLGDLEMTNYYEACVELGAGKSCRITPKIINHKNLQLTMALESREADGKTTGLSVTQVVAQPGKSLKVAVGGMNLTLTPKLAAE